MPNNNQWPEELTNKMLGLYFDGETNVAIAEAIGKSLCSVKQQLSKVRRERKLPYRDIKQIVANRGKDKVVSAFDKAYHGPIPCGHWLICKKWELTQEQKDELYGEQSD